MKSSPKQLANLTRKGIGRPAGIANKITRSVRETFEQVFIALQSHETASLKAFAERKPEAFYALATKLIPAQVSLEVKGTITERLLQARKATGK